MALRGVSALGIGLNTIFGRRAGTRPGIVNYHRIAWAVPDIPDPMHNVTPAVFREQLEGLLSRGFTAWSLERLLEHARQQQPVPPKTFAVTFDDGFETVYTRAWPVLKELNVPASLFVNTAYLDLQDPFPFDEWGVRYRRASPAEAYRPLTLDQIREMVASGLMDLGAHTHTHEDFRGRPDEMTTDIAESVEFLRKHFGLNEVTFAFPFGSSQRGFAGSELVAAAKRAGVTCGLTTDPMLVDLASDPFEWGRFNAFAWDTSASLAAKLNGWYSWAPRWKRRLASRWKR
ncbi:MAG: polysaccharide deacetylase family protein [Pirellulaceae bacterium]